MTGFPILDHSEYSQDAARHAEPGRLTLQVCGQCSTIQYPYREICRGCLSGDLKWQEVAGEGEIIASTGLYASSQQFFRDHSPWRIASIRLDAGISVIARLAENSFESGSFESGPVESESSTLLKGGDRVQVTHEQVSEGQVALVAREVNT